MLLIFFGASLVPLYFVVFNKCSFKKKTALTHFNLPEMHLSHHLNLKRGEGGPIKVKTSFFKIHLRDAFNKKKYYLDREIVPISSDPPTIGPVSEHLDRECW